MLAPNSECGWSAALIAQHPHPSQYCPQRSPVSLLALTSGGVHHMQLYPRSSADAAFQDLLDDDCQDG